MSHTVDVIIVGAGIMGCSAAFQLAKRGLKVVVVEMAGVGNGSTGKSSAIIRQHYSNELTARMALHSVNVFQHFDDAVGGESGFTQTGFLVLAPAKDQAGLEANIALQRRVGIRTELVSPAAAREFVPGLFTDDLIAAAYEPDAGYADPYLTVNAFAAAARRHGAKIMLDTPVTNIRFHAGKVVGVDTPADSFDAPVVVNTAGPWGARVGQMAGLTLPINACRIQVSFFKRPPAYQAGHPVVADFCNALYFRSETGGLTLVGMIDPAEAAAVVNPDKFNTGVDFDFIADTGERLIRRFPPMEQSQSAGGYADLYAITPDWHPIIDELPAGSGFYVCAGFSGHGFKLGPAVGVMMADLITGVAAPEFSPQMFRFGRYAEDKPVRGQYEYSIAG